MATKCMLFIVVKVVIGLATIAYAGEIHDAVRNGDIDKVNKLLKNNPLLVKARESSYFDSMPLHLAAMDGNLKITELLLANGAEINAKDCGGWTPLMRAVANKKKNIVKLLLANNANVNLSMNIGRTALHYAVMNDDKEIASILLLHHADVNAGNGGEYDPPPIHEAQNAEMIELLLLNKAIIDAKNKDGETALHKAALFNSNNIAYTLLLHKADVNAIDNIGRTPLHWAAWRDCRDVAGILLENGAKTSIKDNDGNTPLKIAIERDNKALVDLLKEAIVVKLPQSGTSRKIDKGK